MTDDVSDISDLPEEMQPHIMVDALYNERDRWQSDLDKHVMEIDELGMKVVNLISAEAILERDPARQAA